MSPRTFVTRAAALFALAALGAACETKTIVQPPPTDIVVTVSPLQATLTKVGQQVQFVAQVTGAGTNGNTGVTWKSSNTAVATVAATGNTATVTAVANGVTSIIATSAQDANKQSSAVVTVAIDSGQKVVPPTVSINSITTLAGTPVDVNNVQGPANIILNVDVPPGNNVSAVNWLLDGKAFCTQSFTQGKSADATTQAADAVTMSCQINTAAVDATGKPLYANGPHALSATLVSPTGTVLASTTQQLVFANENAINVTAKGAVQKPDAAGLQWNGGDLTVTVTPTIFDTQVLQTVTVQVHDANNGKTAVKVVPVTSNAAFTVVFPNDSTADINIHGFEDATTTVTVTGAVTAAGQDFVGHLNHTELRFDTKAPTENDEGPTWMINTVGSTSWLSVLNTFDTACTVDAVIADHFNCQLETQWEDEGVDLVKATFQISPATGTKVWTSVTALSALSNTAANVDVARLQVCDNLGNCNISANSPVFGIDVTPPVVQAVTSISGVKTAPQTISVAAIDSLSGFDLTNGYIQVQVTKDSAKSDGSDVKSCINASTDAESALPSSGTCAFVTIPGPLPAGQSFVLGNVANQYPNGYYTVVIQAADIAGNISTQTNRFFLMDAVAPTVSGVSVSYTTGTLTAGVGGTIKDNVDLQSYAAYETFGAAIAGVTAIPFAAPTVVKAYGIPVNGKVTATATTPVILGVAAAFGVAGTNSTGFGFGGLDQAGNFALGTVGLVPGTTAAVSAADTAGGPLTGPTKANLCDGALADCDATHQATSTQDTVVLVMKNTTTANPIVTMYFYRVVTLGGTPVAQFVSSMPTPLPGIPSSGTYQNLRVYTYKSAIINAADMAAGANSLFAIGVDKNGNGVLFGPVTVDVQAP